MPPLHAEQKRKSFHLVACLLAVVACGDDDPSSESDASEPDAAPSGMIVRDAATGSQPTNNPKPSGNGTPVGTTDSGSNALPPEMTGATDAGTSSMDGGTPAADTMDASSTMIDATLPDATLDAALEVDASDASAKAPDEVLFTRLLARLRECNVVGPGTYNERPIQDALDRCAATCLLAATCSSVHDFRCMGYQEPVLGNCFGDCTVSAGEGEYTCGDGAHLSSSFLCDGFPDCSMNEDEVDCPEFACKTGNEKVTGGYIRCNGIKDCADESDEDGCASYCD